MSKERRALKIELKVPCKGPELRMVIDELAGRLPDYTDDWNKLGTRNGFFNDRVHRLFAEELEKVTYGDMKLVDWPLTSRRYLALAEVMLGAAHKPGFDWLWVVYTAARFDDEYADKFEVDVRDGRLVVLEKFAKLFAPFLGSDLSHTFVTVHKRLTGKFGKEGA